jgi:hypothetical protein
MTDVERLQYFNGQRLEAADLSLEQHYHIEMRRLLNQGLFAPGVVNGLVVTAADPHTATVSPGLALDPLGREVVLTSQQSLAVPNSPPVQANLGGYFLTIRYGEVPVPGSVDGCRAPLDAMQPSRVVEQPTLGWTETWPNRQLCGQPGGPENCAIVLAKVNLDNACAISTIDAGARQWAQVIVPGQVHAFALEGSRDIDASRPGVLHFSVRGGQPRAVILYLWGEQFTPYYYTELGSHTHAISGGQTDPAAMPNHAHDITNAPTASGTSHNHRLQVAFSDSSFVVSTIPTGTPVPWPNFVTGSNDREGPPFVIDEGDQDPTNIHTHTLTATTSGPDAGAATHYHGLQGGADRPAGVADIAARSNGALSYGYVNNMVVKLDNHPITSQIIGPPLNWPSLGDGTACSQLVQMGTGCIDLIERGVTVDQGEHVLEFSVTTGGGRFSYNLYIE